MRGTNLKKERCASTARQRKVVRFAKHLISIQPLHANHDVSTHWLQPEDYGETKMDMARCILLALGQIKDLECMLHDIPLHPFHQPECIRGLEPHIRTILVKEGNSCPKRRSTVKAIVQYSYAQRALHLEDEDELSRVSQDLTEIDRERARQLGLIDAFPLHHSEVAHIADTDAQNLSSSIPCPAETYLII